MERPFRLFKAGVILMTLAGLNLAGCGGGGVNVPGTPAPAPTLGPGGSLSVTNLNEYGAGTLRSAITAVNAMPANSSSVITFAVTGKIYLASALPAIKNAVKIDGTSAPGYTGNKPLVEIDAGGSPGLVFAAGSNNSQLVGIAVTNATGNGVTLVAGNILLNNDYIGLDLSGNPAGNGGDGVSVTATSSNNQIGVNTAAASNVVTNVISANAGNGLSFHGSSGNLVVDNRIGTDPSGTVPLGNGANGIWITAGSQNNEIGGTAFTNSTNGAVNDPTGNKGTVTPVFVVPPLGNQVSANRGVGILIDAGSTGNVLNGNFVGTDPTGDIAMGNASDGVRISGANNNSLIGCQFVNNPFVYYNVLSANGGNGLRISSSNNTTVQANFFGVGANNTTPLGNRGDGILVDGNSQNTTVGGVIPLGNVSAGNGQNGIEVKDTASSFTTFNTFGGLLAFKGAAPNGNDGLLITATGGNQTVRTNVFSGNANNGIEIAGDASGVNVNPNMVGLVTNGNAPLPNGGNGILIGGTAHGNIVGGFLVSVIPQNTFSGNALYGISIVGAAHDNQVINSDIGTDTLGTNAQPNLKGGIFVGGTATHNLIGGVTTDPKQPQANLISGNNGNGVTLAGGTSYISVIGNFIGLDRFGAKTIPNTGLPIVVDPLSLNDTISGNVIK